jgi:hypothetical protein
MTPEEAVSFGVVDKVVERHVLPVVDEASGGGENNE